MTSKRKITEAKEGLWEGKLRFTLTPAASLNVGDLVVVRNMLCRLNSVYSQPSGMGPSGYTLHFDNLMGEHAFAIEAEPLQEFPVVNHVRVMKSD